MVKEFCGVIFEVIVILIVESEPGEDAKQKKLDNAKPAEPTTPEPTTPDYAAGLAPVSQPNKVILSISTHSPFSCVNIAHTNM